MDFLYFIHEGATMKKELTEKVKYLLMFEADGKQVKFQKVTNDVILRKIKPQAPSQKKIKHAPMHTVICRKPFESEAVLKSKLLRRMAVLMF